MLPGAPPARVRCAKCGTAFSAKPSSPQPAADPDSLVGKRLGDYQVIALIAKGGMGAIYQAKQITLGRTVALKQLSRDLKDKQFVRRFMTEARAAAKLSHPNIVQVYDVGCERGVHYLTMEFVEGESVYAKLQRDGAFAPRRAVEIAIDVANALACARASNIVHRDIKPHNVLLSDNGQTKVTDFGLAKLIDDPATGATQEGLGLGTPHYMAPEQATNAKAADHRADIYSLGATLYHMLTGRPPFIGASAYQIVRQHETEQAIPPAEYNPDIPDSLCEVIAKMMAKSVDDRHQEPADAAQELKTVLGEIKALEAQAESADD